MLDQFLVEREGLAEEEQLHLVVEELQVVGEGLQLVEGTFQATS